MEFKRVVGYWFRSVRTLCFSSNDRGQTYEESKMKNLLRRLKVFFCPHSEMGTLCFDRAIFDPILKENLEQTITIRICEHCRHVSEINITNELPDLFK